MSSTCLNDFLALFQRNHVEFSQKGAFKLLLLLPDLELLSDLVGLLGYRWKMGASDYMLP